MILNEGEDAAILTFKECKGDANLGSEPSEAIEVEGKNDFFWSREHKLGISTEYLYPLYKAAKHRFMDVYATYKKHSCFSLKNENADSSHAFSEIENAVMKHSKALLLLSSDFGTAWNARLILLVFSWMHLLILLAVLAAFFYIFSRFFLSGYLQCCLPFKTGKT